MTVPENLILLECSECKSRRTTKPDNTLYKTGGLECPECSEVYKSIAKYERVGVSFGETDNEY